MNNAKKAIWTALYALGALIVAVLLFLMVAGPRCVLFPDAMLPMDLRELASAWLGIGFLPMLLVSAQVYKVFRKKVLFIPVGVCLLALLFWVGVWTAGMLSGPGLGG